MLNPKICIFGLGYVGLPLAAEFSKYYRVIGFDINKLRVKQLHKGNDINLQLNKKKILSPNLKITNNFEDILNSNIYIITVPTPINYKKEPNLNPLKTAANRIAKCLNKGNIVILESTVYPGLTNEVLIPLLEKKSGLKINKDFFVGYSPERISPGDKSKDLTNIKKVVSASNKFSRKKVYALYKKIIKAGVYIAPNIKVAEASKILENVQRDINISLMNEVSIIFDKLKIDTHEVLKASSTKWNFLKFTPGLVGGHCISVDPYYLKFRAKRAGYTPDIITSGRNVNENMAKFIFKKIKFFLKKRNYSPNKFNLGIMGVTFKENCPDTRNSQIFKIIKLLKSYKIKIELLDPLIKKDEIPLKFQNFFVKKFSNKLDCLILATPHKQFLKLKKNYFENILKNNSMIFDVKNKLNFRFKKKINHFSL